MKAGDKVVINYTKPTAIAGVRAKQEANLGSAAMATARVYDLSGRLAVAASHGVLITQGKKTIK